MKLNYLKIVTLTVFTLMVCAVSPAEDTAGEAEVAPGKASEKTKGGLALEEVIVTASKREESFRLVPSGIAVMTGEDLDKVGADDFQDFQSYLPNVSSSSAGKGFNRVVIRGVTSGAATAATGVYVDESPVGSSSAHALGSGALDFIPFDMKRVEVLSGPQGALYGASAMGGLLKYATNKPDPNEWELVGQYQESDMDEGSNSRSAKATINIPLMEEVAAIRMSAFDESFGGYIDNPRRGAEDVDGSETDAYRISLLMSLPSDVQIGFGNMEQRINRAGNSVSDRDGRTSKPVNGDLEDSVELEEPFESIMRMKSLEVSWGIGRQSLFGVDLGEFDLVSSTSIQEQKTRLTLDITRLFGAVLGTGETIPFFFDDHTEIDKITQEFRLSTTHEKYEWQLGAYYTEEEAVQSFVIPEGEVSLLDGLVTIPPTSSITGIGVFTGVLDTEYNEKAVFASFTYFITKKLDLTIGYRRGEIEQDYVQAFSGLLGNPENPQETKVETNGSKDIVENYLFNPRYRVTDDIMVYFRAANGFRAGGPNFVTRDATTREVVGKPTFEPDELDNFEIGAKTAYFDNRLTLDAALYTVRWENIQLVANRNGVNNLENGGDARIDGAEISSRVQPFSWLAITGSASTIDARLEEDSSGIGAREGSRLELSPKFSSSVLVDTFFKINDWLSVTAGLTYSYTGERNSGFEGSSIKPLYKLPQYETYGARASLGFPYFDVTVAIKNIKDERGQISAATADYAADSDNPVRATIIQPRTFTATITARY